MRVSEYRQSATSPLRYQITLTPKEMQALAGGTKLEEEHMLNELSEKWAQLAERSNEKA